MIINNEIEWIIEHSNGEVWLGTMGGLFKRRGDFYQDYDKSDGLSELSIHALAEDKNGNIWIGTFGGGLHLLSQQYDSLPISVVSGNDLLSSRNIYSLAFLQIPA